MSSNSEPLDQEKPSKSGGLGRLIAAVVVIAAGIALAYKFGLFEYLSMDNVKNLQAWFESFGLLAPVIFVLLWIAACIFFLPGLPVTLVGAFIFGPIWGTVYSAIGATLGATAAFLVGRYGARSMVEGLLKKHAVLRKIDDGVEEQGWRMLMITRLVPIFPFNAQNYVYGLTKIPLLTYVVVSALCMLPATAAFNFAAGALAEGKGVGRMLVYLGLAAIVFVLLSLIPKFLKKKVEV